MPLSGVIGIGFDPVVEVADLGIRWQTIALSVALIAALALAARIALAARDGLRPDDLLYIVLGVVPGAVVGGRVVHGIVFWEFYAADPLRLLDPATGSLSLLGAVLGGSASGAYVASLLEAPIRRWADAVAVPLLLALGLGKVAQFLGGSGQGAPFDGPWAVAFVGAGPWHSPDPALAAHPAQIYEALWLLVGIPLLLRVAAGRDLASRLPPRLRPLAGAGRADGTLFVMAVGWFLLGRVVVGFTWRDDPLIGPFNGEQALALVVLVLGGVLLAGHRSRSERTTGAEAEPAD